MHVIINYSFNCSCTTYNLILLMMYYVVHSQQIYAKSTDDVFDSG